MLEFIIFSVITTLIILGIIYDEIAIPIISLIASCFFLYLAISFNAWLIDGILAGFCLVYGIISIKDKFPLSLRFKNSKTNKKHNDNNEKDKEQNSDTKNK